MNVERLQHLRDVVIPLARRKAEEGALDFRDFMVKSECGTVGCLAGWAASTQKLQEDGFRLTEIKGFGELDIEYENTTGSCRRGFSALSKYYGLQGQLADALFGVHEYLFSDVYERYGVSLEDFGIYEDMSSPNPDVLTKLNARAALVDALIEHATAHKEQTPFVLGKAKR